MLTQPQQRAAMRSLEEFVAATTSDPIRITPTHLDNLQVILAGVGLLITPQAAYSAETEPQPASQPASQPATQPGQPRRMSETERGIINTAYMAADSLRHNPGYTIKASMVLSIVAIVRSIVGESR